MPDQNQAPSSDYYLVSASGRLGKAPQSQVEDVARIIDKAMAEAPAKGLVLHFHGGLVTRNYALANIVAPLTKTYMDAKAYPLFFVWESGFMDALGNNKAELLQDPAFRELVKKVSEWVLKKVSTSGGVTFKSVGGGTIDDIDEFRRQYDRWFDDQRNTPPVEESDVATDVTGKTKSTAGEPDLDELADEIRKRFDDDDRFKEVMEETFNAANPPAASVTTKGVGTAKRADKLLLSSDALDEMFPPEEADSGTGGKVKTRGFFSAVKVAYYVAKLVIAVIKRFRSDSDHGVYCTVVEEVLRSAYGDLIGATVWNAMKKDTQDSFADADDACGRLVVRKLTSLEDEGKNFKKLTLVGHSTGAIYICDFLDAAKAAGLKTPIHVVFLAPAVTCARFASAVDAHDVTYLQNFRLFAMRDTRESEDAMLRPLYTRSLLYFVSGLLEGSAESGKWESTVDMPLVGMERYFRDGPYGRNAQVQHVRKFLEAKPNRMVWSKAESAAAGLSSDASRHGDFDDDPSTLKSLAEIIGA